MESQIRTVFKTLSWRVFSTCITSLVVWRITSQVELGLAIAAVDCMIKLLVYYFHERAWTVIPFGYVPVRQGNISRQAGGVEE